MTLIDSAPGQVYILMRRNATGHDVPVSAFIMKYEAEANADEHTYVSGPVPLVTGYEIPTTPDHPHKPLIDPKFNPDFIDPNFNPNFDPDLDMRLNRPRFKPNHPRKFPTWDDPDIE